jgi:hypothetical protein
VVRDVTSLAIVAPERCPIVTKTVPTNAIIGAVLIAFVDAVAFT